MTLFTQKPLLLAGIGLLLNIRALDGAPVPVSVAPDGSLLRDGKPYFIKGAGGTTRLDEVIRCGGNSIRTWGIQELPEVLATAEKLGLTICAGIWLEPECSWFSYSKPEDCAQQMKRVLENVSQYKESPALLCWGIGNESEGDGGNAAYWKQLNALARAVKELDPHHPTFTAVAGFSQLKKDGVEKHAPDLDFIGINTYGALPGLRQDLEKMKWTRPWVVTEYGPQGFWERPATEWKAPIEPTSSEKARTLISGYEKSIAPGGACWGGYVFYWGQKQEATATWFGLFTRQGERTSSVDALQKLWTGSLPDNQSPAVKEITALVSKQAIKAGEKFKAAINATDPDGDKLTYRWEVMPEKGGRDKEGRELPLDPLPLPMGLIGHEVEVTAPSKPGEYRLFGYVLDGKGNAGVANVPFRVR